MFAGSEGQSRRVGIITLYSAINHGAFLQAYSLSTYLSDKGFDVCFVAFPRLTRKLEAFQAIKLKRGSAFRSLIFSLHKVFVFRHAQKTFRAVPLRCQSFDALILGSDEIWNVKNDSFPSRSEYFGFIERGVKVVAYAPSSGNSRKEDIVSLPGLCERMRNIDFFSGRDENTIDIISSLTGRSGVRVVDPTFLVDIPQRHYDVGYDDYLLVYSFGLNDLQKQEVLAFAESHKLPVVSVGFFSSWCDKSINVDPFQFLAVFEKAKYIVTDTFHGAAISVKLGKKFAVYSEGKDKVLDFLRYYGFESCSASAVNPISRILNSPVVVSKSLFEQIEISKRFLGSALMCVNS